MGELDQPRPKVFISYSRRNLSRAEDLRVSLQAHQFDAYLDLHDILPGEPWQERLGRLIETADTVLFLLSPSSVTSPIVDWELNEAERLSKRIIPVIIEEPQPGTVPGRMARLNYIFMRTAVEQNDNIGKLGAAINTDIEWIRSHTRYGELAADWDRAHRETSLLLRGEPLVAAEHWLSRRPRDASEITQLQEQFIRSSREAEQKHLAEEKQRLSEVDAAQQKTRRAQRRAFAILTVLLFAVVGGLWGVYTFWTSVMLNRSQMIANQAQELTEAANDPVTGMLVSLEGVRDAHADHIAHRLMPRDGAAVSALDAAWRKSVTKPWTERAIATLGKRWPTKLKYSPNGKYIATSTTAFDSDPGSIVISNATDVSRVREFAGEFGDFSPDGSKILVIRDKVVDLVDVETGQVTATLNGHQKRVWRAFFSPDGKIIASTSEDDTARLWSGSGAALRTLNRGAPLFGIAFSPDSHKLALRAINHYWMVDVATGSDLIDMEDFGQTIVAFSPDNELLVVGDGAGLRLWSVASGEAIGHLPIANASVKTVSFSPDSKLLATTTEQGQFFNSNEGNPASVISVWDLQSRSLKRTLTAHTRAVISLAFSPDGEAILSAAEDGTARVWDVRTGKLTDTLAGSRRAATAAAFSPDGAQIALSAQDSTLRLWVKEDGRGGGHAMLTNHPFLVSELAFSMDGKSLATTSVGTSNIINLVTRRVERLNRANIHEVFRDGRPLGPTDGIFRQRQFSWLWKIALEDELTAAGFNSTSVYDVSPDGRFLVVRTDNAQQLWRLTDRKLLSTAAEFAPLVFSASRPLAAIARGSDVELWDLQSGAKTFTLAGHSGEVHGMDFSPDGALLVTGSADRDARIWSVETGRTTHVLHGHSDVVAFASFSPDGQSIVTKARDGSVNIWSAATGQIVHGFVASNSSGGRPIFNATGRMVAASLNDQSVALHKIFDAQTIILRGHTQAVISVAFSKDGALIAAGAGDGSVRIWETGNGGEIAALSGHSNGISAIAFSNDNHWLATGSFDKTARVWPLFGSDQDLVDTVKATTRRCLTSEERRLFRLEQDDPAWCREQKLWPQRSVTTDSGKRDWEGKFLVLTDRVLAALRK